MISDVSLLRRILNKDATIPLNENQGSSKKSVGLKEGNDVFKVFGLSAHSIVIKIDKFPSPENFFKGERGENKRADFVVISETPSKNFIVYIEMKKGSGGKEHEIIKQLKGAQCVIAYCRAVAEKFHGKSKFLDELQYEPRFISIKGSSLNKTPTKRSGKELHDTPEKMLKLKYYKRYEFNRLVGRHYP